MRNITRVSLVLAGSAALVGSMALPASAADTTTTVTVPSGTIAIAAPASASFASPVTPGTTATVSLPGVQVTDNRAGTVGWTASVASSAFSGAKVNATTGASLYSIAASNASYTAGAATVVGTATVAASAKQTDLSSAKTAQTASAVTGNHTANWAGTLELAVPSNAIADDYTALVTHSVL